MQKVEKEFILSDSTLNCYGFRLLTSGYMMDEFKKNPIGYYMHQREKGVAVRWDELTIKGDKVTAKPVINLSTARGQQIVDEVNNGFLNAASMGHIIVLDSSDDPSLMLPGQTGPTITKWYNKECSLVDIPGNSNSLTLHDKHGEVINLQNFKVHKLQNNSNHLSIERLAHSVIIDETVELQLKRAYEQNTIQAEQMPTLKKHFENRPNDLKDLLQSFSLQRLSYLLQMPWVDLDKNDLLKELKTKDLMGFKKRFKEHFNTEYIDTI